MERPIRSDQRYTVNLEPCLGYDKPRFVARFCGDFVGQSYSYPHAVMLCATHGILREGGQVIVGIEKST